MSIGQMRSAYCPTCHTDTLHQRWICLTCRSDNKPATYTGALKRITKQLCARHGRNRGHEIFRSKMGAVKAVAREGSKDQNEIAAYKAEASARARRNRSRR